MMFPKLLSQLTIDSNIFRYPLGAEMAQTMRKITAPISMNQSCGHEQEKRSMNLLPKHFERRSVVPRAVMWGMLVIAIGMSLDASVTVFHWSWLGERLVENTIEGVLFALFIWVFLNAREKRLQHRFREVGYLNHHIRNSLATIQMADGYVAEAAQRSELIANASTRIRLCVEKISREQDCAINERSPERP
jgi:hypothetical protein